MINLIMPKRKWKYIEGYEYKYQVSNLGDVRSLLFDRKKILKPYIDTDGYCIVYLYKYRKSKSYRIHRLVANAFLPNPNNLPQVNHIDENTSNNCLWNLEWCDSQYNCNHGTRNLKISNKLSKPVVAKHIHFNIFVYFKNEYEAVKWLKCNGYPKANVSSINRCCNFNSHYAYNFIWRFEQEVCLYGWRG